MLYTSYLTKLNDLPKDMTKILITRFVPKWFDINKYPNTYLEKSLAPSSKLLLQFKKDNNWDKYVKDFNEEMKTRQDMKEALNTLLSCLKNGNDIILVCYEKDYNYCHRSLIGEWIKSNNIKWEEYKF